jgi:hypothetical protein
LFTFYKSDDLDPPFVALKARQKLAALHTSDGEAVLTSDGKPLKTMTKMRDAYVSKYTGAQMNAAIEKILGVA